MFCRKCHGVLDTYSVRVRILDDEADLVRGAKVQLYTTAGSLFSRGEWSQEKRTDESGRVWFIVSDNHVTKFIYVDGHKFDVRGLGKNDFELELTE
jgi:hypothetical protein